MTKAYAPDGGVKTITASNPTTGDQTTQYVFGTTLTDSDVARSDLLRAVIYPDSDDVASPLGDGADGIYDRVELKYNRQGEIKERKDQNGTVHAFDRDKLGRQTHDRVTTLGTGIDGAVRRSSWTNYMDMMACTNAIDRRGSLREPNVLFAERTATHAAAAC